MRFRRSFTGRTRSSAGAVLRALAVFDLFLKGEKSFTVTALARELGIHKSTASRLLAALESTGYLERFGAQKFRLGPKIVTLGLMAGNQLELRQAARPFLEALVAATGETAHLGVLQGSEAVTVDFVDGLFTIRMRTEIGKRSPAYCTALGKALLAGLSQDQLSALFGAGPLKPRTSNTITDLGKLSEHLKTVRKLGYSLDSEELEFGLCCVGAPVFDRFGQVIAAVSISGPANRFTTEKIPLLGRKVKAAAVQISLRLGAPHQRAFWGEQPAPDELSRSLYPPTGTTFST